MHLRPPSTLVLASLVLSVLACVSGGTDAVSPAPSPEPAPVPGPSPSPPAPGDLPKTAGSFETAKKWLYEKVHYDHRYTLYCGCPYDADRDIDLASCGLQELASKSRARRVEAEHVVPAARLGGHLPCWNEPLCKRSSGQTYKGRECCEDMEPWFEAAHNDLHNLFPSVGELNGARGDLAFGEVPGEKRAYGDCDFEIDRDLDLVEPPEDERGEIARAYLYMEATYGLALTEAERSLMQQWHKADPPEDWERERNRRIAEIQGKANPFVGN